MKILLDLWCRFRRGRLWKWLRLSLILAIVYVIIVETGLRTVTKIMWRPLSDKTAQEYVANSYDWIENQRQENQARPCPSGVRTLELNVTLAGGIDYLGSDETYLEINMSNTGGFLREPNLYNGPPTHGPIVKKIPYCADGWEGVNTQDPANIASWISFSIIAVNMRTNEYINMDSDDSYPVAAWKDVTIELYPWGESTLEEGFYNGHHVYPNDPAAVVPERFRRKQFSPLSLAPWR